MTVPTAKSQTALVSVVEQRRTTRVEYVKAMGPHVVDFARIMTNVESVSEMDLLVYALNPNASHALPLSIVNLFVVGLKPMMFVAFVVGMEAPAKDVHKAALVTMIPLLWCIIQQHAYFRMTLLLTATEIAEQSTVSENVAELQQRILVESVAGMALRVSIVRPVLFPPELIVGATVAVQVSKTSAAFAMATAKVVKVVQILQQQTSIFMQQSMTILALLVPQVVAPIQ
jgi:cellulose synthase/poly-beta-1,6-N-acetylglucosamine synthase-like glycosyltransferase